MKRAIKILFAVIGILLVLILAAVLFYFITTSGTKLDAEKLALPETAVTIYDCKGEEIDFYRERKSARLDELPEYLPRAFVAVEDKRFYDHKGLDVKRMIKAAVKNLSVLSFREGASTISQQLIKNTHLSNEKTITRKLKEIKLARALEKRFSKEEILELYLNSIYFGHGASGISDASQFYFGKEPKDLSPAECAMLAALAKSPNRYSPFRDADKCLARRNFVLSLMSEQNFLSQEEVERAKEEPLPISPADTQKKNAYLDLVFAELSELFPDSDAGNTLKVYTFLDKDLQKELESTETNSDFCVLIRDNFSHGIKALHSTCGLPKRLPASAIKPLAVYGPALEENLISPATPILDEKIDFDGYSPSNYGGEFGGYMSARYALSRSVNVPAVKLLNSLGVKKAVTYLEKMDLPVDKDDETLALALGGMKKGFTLPALADGYAVFANEGNFSPSALISRVEDASGKTIYTFSPEKRKVFSDDVCALMNDMLQTAVKEGTAKRLKALAFPVCAKTGTGATSAGNIDAYTLAYTRADTVAVWLGNRDNSPISATGGGIPADIALRVLRALYPDKTPPEFSPCEEVVRVAVDREEYEKNHRLLLADPTAPDCLSLHELFRKCALPQTTCTKFSCPEIEKPLISLKNGAVCIILCQTEYYDYEVKRESDGEFSTIYSGKYRKEIVDNSVRSGKTYTYTVTPSYCGIEGKTIELPPIKVESEKNLPDNWWE